MKGIIVEVMMNIKTNMSKLKVCVINNTAGESEYGLKIRRAVEAFARMYDYVNRSSNPYEQPVTGKMIEYRLEMEVEYEFIMIFKCYEVTGVIKIPEGVTMSTVYFDSTHFGFSPINNVIDGVGVISDFEYKLLED